MAKEYIEREKALSNIDKAFKMFQDHDDMLRLYSDTRLAVIVEPAADVAEVRHAKWVHSEIEDDDWGRTFHEWTCSVCGYSVAHNPTGENYCPNCGAKMDKEEVCKKNI